MVMSVILEIKDLDRFCDCFLVDKVVSFELVMFSFIWVFFLYIIFIGYLIVYFE